MIRAGYAALLGRPNVGKSTLLNRTVGQKISITSPKPQTTRQQVLGIKTRDDAQIVYVDTPGLHVHAPQAINRAMNRAASRSLEYVDVVVWMIEALRWTDDDQAILQPLARFSGPVILAINKTDRVKDKARLLPFMDEIREHRDFHAIVPLSVNRQDNLDLLEESVVACLPEGEPLYPPDQVTTISQRFLAAELIREKLFRRLNQELPYALAVEIEHYGEEDGLVRIHAVIWVERPGQRAIVIGHGGSLLRDVGQQVRLELERELECRVFLQTWVKVRNGWSDDERALQSFGYQD